MSSIKRDKYEKAKKAAREWHSLYEQTLSKLEQVTVENEELKSDVLRWRKLSEELPDKEELEQNSKEYRKTIRNLKDKSHEESEKLRYRITELEREQILHQGKIQQLEEAKKDLRERYQELKQDYRELLRGGRGSLSSVAE